MTDEHPVKRTSEIEEPTNLYVIHPISRSLVTVLARWGVRPNAVSVAGMVLGGAAGGAYYYYASWPATLAGFLLMVGWHIADGADGQLARLTGQTSEIGKVLDGLCDHLAFAAVYVGLTLAASQSFGGWVWGVAALAGVSHLVQASAYEFQRQSYDFWVHDRASARIVMPDELRRERGERRGLARLFDGLHLAYLRLQHRIAGVDAGLVADLGAARRNGRGAEVAEAYRASHLDLVRRWSVLCSNYRTIAIFVACLAGNPLYFFLFEIALLNPALVALRVAQARANRGLLGRLAGATAPSAPALHSAPA